MTSGPQFTYGSVCSGIEAATVAWHPLGWKPAFFSEIEKSPCSVLKHHYPEVPNHGDMTKFKEWPDHAINLLIGGTPCQSFSVAGLRKGMADPRGNLALTFLAIVDRYRPEWVVWENVPGVLSSNGGRDFGSFLGGLGQLGYGFAYRVLDAQFVRVESHPRAVPQRRRRVFVVGHIGDWRRAAAVLFERQSLSGDSSPRRQTGERIAGTIEASLGRSRGAGQSTSALTEWPAEVAPTLHTSWAKRSAGSQAQEWDSQKGGHFVPDVGGTLTNSGKAAGSATQQDAESGMLLAFGGNDTRGPIEVATARTAHGGPHGRLDFESETFVARTLLAKSNSSHAADQDTYVARTLRANHDASEDGTGRGTPIITFPINTQIALRHEATGESTGMGIGEPDDPSFTLQAAHSHAVAFQSSQSGVRIDDVHATLDSNNGSRRHNGTIKNMAVRRLTPVECCRLQGFPDDYLDCLKSDGPRYKALGNSMATNVIRYLGDRINLVRAI